MLSFAHALSYRVVLIVHVQEPHIVTSVMKDDGSNDCIVRVHVLVRQ